LKAHPDIATKIEKAILAKVANKGKVEETPAEIVAEVLPEEVAAVPAEPSKKSGRK
jgi:hypothetical protein